MVLVSVVSMILALFFYTLGVWGERLKARLTPTHVILFWIGFVFDTTGTTMMSLIAKNTSHISIHSITGGVALVLMAIHALWATYVIRKSDQVWIEKFHRFSIFVWALWLIPFLTGMFLNMF